MKSPTTTIQRKNPSIWHLSLKWSKKLNLTPMLRWKWLNQTKGRNKTFSDSSFHNLSNQNLVFLPLPTKSVILIPKVPFLISSPKKSHPFFNLHGFPKANYTHFLLPRIHPPSSSLYFLMTTFSQKAPLIHHMMPTHLHNNTLLRDSRCHTNIPPFFTRIDYGPPN